MRNGRGAATPTVGLPRSAGRFAHIVDILHAQGPAEGFRAARDLLFTTFETLKRDIPPYALLKLCIEMDRHAQMCEIAAERARGRYDETTWTQFQEYLNGHVDVAPTAPPPGRPTTVDGDGVAVRLDPDDLPDADLDRDAVEDDDEETD